jgi:hypothetical protein
VQAKQYGTAQKAAGGGCCVKQDAHAVSRCGLSLRLMKICGVEEGEGW